ncbi:MAG TPA: sigma-70 family RNA polymerase sigma factor [Verrucomicrobiae bacterium]|jgi:RNA polymerase sigma factor (sigma-70 family)
MPDPDDIDLLRRFARTGSESAFAALVERHLNLVYSTALRHTGNVHTAEEIAQAVFIILARKAAGLSNKVILSGWLYQTTRLTAANHERAEFRRQKREQEAYMESAFNQDLPKNADWQQMSPWLDSAMAGLRQKERDALVLKFFEGRSLAEVGVALGIEERAAQKRVSRGLERLRDFFARRGVHSTPAAIGETIAGHALSLAGPGLATVVSAGAVKGSAAGASTLSLVNSTLKIMTYTKIKFALTLSALVLLAGGAVTVALSQTNAKTPSSSSGSAVAQTGLVVAAQFIYVPDDVLSKLSLAPVNATTAILSRSENTNLLNQMKKSGVTVFATPRLAFPLVPGGKPNTGTLSMTKQVKASGTNADVGVILNVSFTLSANSQSVALDTAIACPRLVDDAIQTVKANASSTLKLNPSQTLLIDEPVPDSNLSTDSNTNLFVLITPQITHFAQRIQKVIPRKTN